MIKVLVVDDSAVIRKVLATELAADPDIEVMGTASDPYVARTMIAKQKPDVITLDIEMPRMDGLTFLSKLMKHFPIPVIIVSSVAAEGSQNAIQALALGAVDVLFKSRSAYSASGLSKELIGKIKMASGVNVEKKILNSTPAKQEAPQALACTTNGVVAIGASTGGTRAIESILMGLPHDAPGILIVQHMPKNFTGAFAQRLDKETKLSVREAVNGDIVRQGEVLVAPGETHMLLKRSGATYQVEIKDGPKVSGHKPSVDVLFRSVARAAGPNALGLLLTGMGTDGGKGMLDMKNAGSKTVAQDEASCIVYGMPKAAVDLNATTAVANLIQMPQFIINHGSQTR